jgi:hypothetical protein
MRRRHAFSAERAFGGGIRRDVEPPQGFDRDTDVRGTPGAVDEHRGPNDVAAR